MDRLTAEMEGQLRFQAQQITGLSDFGQPEYPEALTRLLNAFATEAKFTEIGRERAYNFLLDTLIARLHSQDGWKENPRALRTGLQRPVVITGIPRSGTTALHKLMSLDPQFQGLEHWLSRTPTVRPPRSEWSSHPLYRRAARTLDEMLTDQPVIKSAHGQAVDEVDECYNLLTQSFTVLTFGSVAGIPSYDEWYIAQDETLSYARYRDNLRLIGANEPDKRWLVKNPNHIFAIDALLAVFPDALIVQTHRNPLEAIPSVCSLTFAGRRFYEGPGADPAAVGRRNADHWERAVERAQRAKERRGGRDWLDVGFKDFVQAPMSIIRSIYERFSLALTPEVEARMQQWLANNPRNKHGEHRYALQDFGLAGADLRRRYRHYIEANRL
jgi:hypothetical protein